MHELAICQSLIEQLDVIASDHPEKIITIVHIQIGPLSGVEPELLSNAFPIASAGTAAANAKLLFHDSSVRVHCSACDTDSNVSNNNLICGECGNWQTQLIAGDELILQRVELESGELADRVVH